jgi:hypothetical protein
VEADAGIGELARDGTRDALAEDRKRRTLRGDEHELGGALPVLLESACGHQGELVRRQLPAGARRHHERDPPHLTRLRLVEQPDELRAIAGGPPGERGPDGDDGPGADGHDQRVVGELRAERRPDRAGGRVHGSHGVADEQGVRNGRDVGDGQGAGAPGAEGLGRADGVKGKPLPRLDQREVDALGSELAQGEQRFEARDATAGHDDSESGCTVHALMVAAAGARAIGTVPRSDAVNYGRARRDRTVAAGRGRRLRSPDPDPRGDDLPCAPSWSDTTRPSRPSGRSSEP